MTRTDERRTAAHLWIYELSSRSVLLLLRLPGLPSALTRLSKIWLRHARLETAAGIVEADKLWLRRG